MTRLPTNNSVYYNSRYSFLRQNRDDWHTTFTLGDLFHKWLLSQGCRIVGPDKEGLLADSVGIVQGYHWLEFEDDALATVFVLRWS
jgi:hypothetical protein